MKQYLSWISMGLMAVGLVGLTIFTALAKTRPFHLVEQGRLSFGTDGTVTAEGTGTATHLGSITIHRTFTLKQIPGETDLQVDGQATLTAANGDLLESSIKGTLNPTTGRAVLTYEWKGGTGRFRDATGTTLWLVDVDAIHQTYDLVADGVIDF